MKIHIVNKNQNPISGYKKIIVDQQKIDFQDVSDNECQFIMANQLLNDFDHTNIGNCISSLLQKLRIGGTLVIGGVEMRMFSKSVINGLITPENASNNILNCLSMTDATEVSNLIRTAGLNIVSTQINGIHYEITAKR
jgi:hypothetical protein